MGCKRRNESRVKLALDLSSHELTGLASGFSKRRHVHSKRELLCISSSSIPCSLSPTPCSLWRASRVAQACSVGGQTVIRTFRAQRSTFMQRQSHLHGFYITARLWISSERTTAALSPPQHWKYIRLTFRGCQIGRYFSLVD